MRALLLVLALAADPSPIRLIVRPQVAHAPSDVVILVRLLPAAEDRALVVQMDGIDFYRSSGETIDGLASRRLFRFEWKDCPAGEYEIRADLKTATTTRATAVDRVILTGP